ncbi:hypothetical protein LINGRAPRIM_LOCUS199 [Linum grandiflorum]
MVKSRLVRYLLSPSWIALFPRNVTHNLSDNGSDHRAILLSNSLNHTTQKNIFSLISGGSLIRRLSRSSLLRGPILIP